MKRNRKLYLHGPIYLSILALSSCIQSLIHLPAPPPPCTFHVQNAGLSLRGGRNTNVNDNKLLFVPELDRHFLAMSSQVRTCTNQTDWDPFELDTSCSQDSACHTCNILKWTEVPFPLFLLKSFSRKLICFVLFSIHVTIQSNLRI